MGTPLKNMARLSPRFISPNFLSITTNNTERTRLVPKRIKFSDSDKTRTLTPVKICISPAFESLSEDIKKRDILINTPNKQILCKNGVEKEKRFNILGRGNYGKVFKAVYKDQPVAMKLLKTNNSYLREKNALRLKHKNIVKTVEVIEKEKGFFSLIIMEYFPNSINLHNIISNARCEINFLKYAQDICEGVLYCHSNNILHLDLKPSNILVYDDVCKICDFGNSTETVEVTKSFIHQGTIHYTAPEILLGKKPTEKADVYSLGVIFWQMKTQQFPYETIDNIECVIYKVVKCHLRPSMEKPTDTFAAMYQQCWNKSPCERPNVSDILKMLSTF